MRLILLAVALLASTTANAAKWTRISMGEESTLSIDLESIRSISPNEKAAWFEHAIRADAKDIEYNRVLTLSRVNCSNDTVAAVSFVGYRKAGGIDDSGPVADANLDWKPAPPGTAYGTMIRALCSR